MSRRSPEAALRSLLKRGPWVYSTWGHKECLYCLSSESLSHREYCPWHDYFIAPQQANPMEINTWYDENLGAD